MSLATSPTEQPVIDFGIHGKVRGDAVTDKALGTVLCHRYLGVPYALPPTGGRRWQKPHPLPKEYRYEDRKYDKFGPKCPQPKYTHRYSVPSPPAPEDEDCLFLNIWMPAGLPPEGGWPIWVHIHGGWLQIGDANQEPGRDLAHLIAPPEDGGAGTQAICVHPSYRLNIFGYFGSDALEQEHGRANFGFFDQRLALEFVYQHAAALNGNAHNITISGLSAGAQSAHVQVLYEYSRSKCGSSYQPLIRRCLLRSGTAVLPCKAFPALKPQYDELLASLGISSTDPKSELTELRKVPAQKLLSTIGSMHHHTFRAAQDGGPQSGGFVSKEWQNDMRSGAFSKWCKQNDISFMIGEVANEEQLYRLINPPKAEPTFHAGLLKELGNYYVAPVVDRLVDHYALPAEADGSERWADVLGEITSDAQVFAAERLLLRYLLESHDGDGLGPEDVLRFHIERRAAFFDLAMPPSTGAFHGTCEAVFKYLRDVIMLAEDRKEASVDLTSFRAWLLPLLPWIRGDAATARAAWTDTGGKPVSEDDMKDAVRVLRRDGTISVGPDPLKKLKAPRAQALEEAIFS